ncbi:hydrogenase maturation protease [Mariprofundus aestuarium]|uniref:Hydrogenase maturation protease n=1 Tax=Mariprofundus aestuarium TaxID=1921086 RepID=A0A2K8KYN5_MARES|nr:hydrogenase maturation protease [Mariprofundus aestuarium]ATX79009.1 hydrogenase maturation protease [Mariprofundus aestuarium]
MPKLLILGYGNPGRGDDALGPELVESVQKDGFSDIECQHDMQLQVEYVTDLVNRELILFIDADASCDPPFHFSRISAEKDDSYTSHAMTPHAVLHAYKQVFGVDAPPAFLLRIRGYQFELGESLSEAASANLNAATLFTRKLLKTQGISHWLALVSGA